MAVQEKFNNLKAGPKEDKVAVASGVAISVVVVLLSAWAIYFFHNIRNNAQQLNLSAGAQDQFVPTSVTDAQRQLQQEFGSTTRAFQDIQDQTQGASAQMQLQQMQIQGTQTDQFGAPNTTY